MSIQKLVRSVIFSLAIITFLLNLTIFFYSQNYYAKYNKGNIKMIEDFQISHQGKNTESEFNELCSKIQPANFKETYFSLFKWSGLMLKVSAISLLGYLLYLFFYLLFNKEKRNEKINFKKAIVVFLLLFFSLVFYWFSIETELGILYCMVPYIK